MKSKQFKTICALSVFMLFGAVQVFAFGASDKGGSSKFAGDYNFGGSTTVEPVVTAAVESLRDVYPQAKISYDGTGSSTGIKGVLAGTYSLGGASRSLKQSEIDDGAVGNAIAYDGVAVLVNKNSVPLQNISKENLTKIYAGEITNWKQVGGPNAEIVVVNRDEASGTRSCFSDATVGAAGKKFVSSAVIVTSNGDMVAKVGSTPYAIGYCGFGYIDRNPGTAAVSIDGVKPEAKNVLNNSYTVSRVLLLVSKGPLKEGTLEKAFVDYLLSAEGQAIVAEEGFIKLK